MKFAYRHAFVAALCAFSPAVAWAQTSESQSSTGDSSSYYLTDAVADPAQGSPSDQAVAPVQGPTCDMEAA